MSLHNLLKIWVRLKDGELLEATVCPLSKYLRDIFIGRNLFKGFFKVIKGPFVISYIHVLS